MRLIIARDYEDMSRRAAALMASQVLRKPDSVLGLGTGSTPLGTYRHLAGLCQSGLVDLSEARTVNLDEYLGLAADHPQSFRHYMEENLFRHVNLNPANVHLPCGTPNDAQGELGRYSALIDGLGGIDLQLLGIGLNGHIGFNEPGDAFSKGVVLASLTESTIQANSRFFKSADEVPRQAISMGIAPIMRAKRLLLLASGAEKQTIMREAVKGPITPRVPASAIQLHPDATVIVDEAAGALLA